MPVPRRRHCSARRDRGRTHKKLDAVQGVVECPRCGKPRLPHRACSACGEYKGRHYGPVKPVTADNK